MNSSKRPLLYWIAGILAFAWCISMVLFPALSVASAKKGIALWIDVVLPALLPFFICANFMIHLGIPKLIGKYFESSFERFLGAPGSSAFVFIISITSGYPMGAKLIGDMGRRSEISVNEAKRMLCFCSTSGPLFLLGTIGAGMLHSPEAGSLIAASHYFGAIANGILFHVFGEKKRSHSNVERFPQNNQLRLMDYFTDSIISAVKTVGIICCYLVIFTMLTDLIEYFKMFGGIDQPWAGFLKGILEMTIGCNEIAADPDIALKLKCVLIAALVSFGGISIFAQSISLLYGLFIHPGYYLAVKLMHGVSAAAFAYALAPLFLKTSVAAGNFGPAILVPETGYYAQLLFSSKMIIMIMVAFVVTVLIGRAFDRGKRRK